MRYQEQETLTLKTEAHYTDWLGGWVQQKEKLCQSPLDDATVGVGSRWEESDGEDRNNLLRVT